MSVGAMLMAIGIVIVFAGAAVAVHDLGVFELESGTLGANAVTDNTGSGLPDDWDRVFAGTDHADAGSTFKHDPLNATIFTGGGSKDDHDLSDWKWKNGSAPDKDELQDAFAARYTHLGDSILYFGADRLDNSGDAQIGFWFLQDDIAATGTPGGGGIKFASDDGVAEHIVGDLLILSDFTGGGTDSHIRVFMWDPSFPGAVDGVLRPLGGSETVSATCGSSANDDFCANVNRPTGSNLTTSPWPFLDKSGHTGFAVSELYEGGVNLSELPVDLSDQCFATLVAETRSSSSVDSVLKDFVADQFQPCESGINTVPSAGSGGSVPVGTSVTDGATVTGTGGGQPTGTVKFYVCDPDQLDAAGADLATVCDVGGSFVDVGGDEPDGEALTGATSTTATATSDAVVVNKVGTWCFRGEYVPAVGSQYDPAVDFDTSECFTVTALQPGISTAQTWTVTDTATLTVASGGGNLSGTLRFRLFTTSDCTGTALVDESFTLTNAASGVQRTTTAATVTTANATTFRWLVEFTSSNSNHNGVTSSCGTERSTLTIVNS
ncbi:MAG: hypothetical protein WAT66_06820 [Actinomycetota bacterium]